MEHIFPEPVLATGHASRCPRAFGWLVALCLTAHVGPVSAQFKLQQPFTGSTAPGWALSGSALLTAPSLDASGQGWLRLTGAVQDEIGLALDASQSFLGNVPVSVRVSYVSWGGTGADGITVFLYDSTQNMGGAKYGGGLGYCAGAGGYLAIGLDEYGNFSNPGDRCGAAGGGPGRVPESLVLRGPLSANNQYLTGVVVTGGIDDPGVGTRPAAKTILVTLTPAPVGYTVTALLQSAAGEQFQTLFSNVDFPYVPPASLSVGFSGGTGGSTNNHELQRLVAATPDDLAVTMTGPATVLEGAPVTYLLTVGNNGAFPIDAADAPALSDVLPSTITGVRWTCAPSGAATCAPAGSGDLNTSALTLPVNMSVTYTITGILEPGTPCGGTVTNSADADFGSASTFIDPNPNNNTASISSTVSCAVTLAANPLGASFGPQTVGVPSTAQTITLTGTNGASVTAISTTGDYSQTNDCSAALTGTHCTIEVVFTPMSEGSLDGTLVIVSGATPTPTIVTLSGTGTNAVPSPFSFVTLNDVDPSTAQVSNPITLTGTNVATTISVGSGAEYSINGGSFTSTPGVVAPGAQVKVRITSSSAYSAASTAVLTIGGVSADFTVNTRAEPRLQNVTVTSGGGSISAGLLAALGLVMLLRLRHARVNVAAALIVALILTSRSSSAADLNDALSPLYIGGGLGEVTGTLSASRLTSHLQADGFDVSASDVQRTSLSGSLYIGYELPNQFAVEAGWSYLGRTRTELQGVEPASLEALLYDASRDTRGGGDAWSLVGRYRWALQPDLSLDMRVGPYRWVTHSDLWLGSIEALDRNDRGWGFVVGLGPRYRLTEHWAVEFGANYFRSTGDNQFVQISAGLDFRLR